MSTTRTGAGHAALQLVVAVIVAALAIGPAGCAPPPAPAVDGGATRDGGTDDDDDDDGARADAGAPDDAGTDVDGGPRSAAFTYEDVAGAVCANGTPVGVGVSQAPSPSTTLVVVFNGGGACWDNVGCFGLNSATHIQTTYSADVLAADTAPFAASGVFDRDDGPFTDAHIAFLPYCTGDLHAGAAVRQYQADLFGQDIRTVHHAGRAKTELTAAHLSARFPDVTQVFVLGISAGGFGAYLNDDVFVAAFPDARVDVVADCAPFVPPQNGLYGTWQSQWTMKLPDGCATCAADFGAVVEHVVATHPERRFGLIATTNDEVIRTFFGYGLNDLTPQVTAVQAQQFATANAKALVVVGTQHVLLGGYLTTTTPAGTSLRDWFDGFVADDPRWISVAP